MPPAKLPFPPAKSRLCRRADAARAFSLVEVALALGIVAFGLTAVLGLMPLGFSQFREAVDITVSSQIKATVTADLKQTPFEELIDTATLPPRYFDDQGLEVASAADSMFTATGNVMRGVRFPASSSPNPNLARVSVQILANRGQIESSAVEPPLAHSTFFVSGVE